MKRIIRIISLLLVMSIMLSLTACKNDKRQDETQPPKESTIPVETDPTVEPTAEPNTEHIPEIETSEQKCFIVNLYEPGDVTNPYKFYITNAKTEGDKAAINSWLASLSDTKVRVNEIDGISFGYRSGAESFGREFIPSHRFSAYSDEEDLGTIQFAANSDEWNEYLTVEMETAKEMLEADSADEFSYKDFNGRIFKIVYDDIEMFFVVIKTAQCDFICTVDCQTEEMLYQLIDSIDIIHNEQVEYDALSAERKQELEENGIIAYRTFNGLPIALLMKGLDGYSVYDHSDEIQLHSEQNGHKFIITFDDELYDSDWLNEQIAWSEASRFTRITTDELDGFTFNEDGDVLFYGWDINASIWLKISGAKSFEELSEVMEHMNFVRTSFGPHVHYPDGEEDIFKMSADDDAMWDIVSAVSSKTYIPDLMDEIKSYARDGKTTIKFNVIDKIISIDQVMINGDTPLEQDSLVYKELITKLAESVELQSDRYANSSFTYNFEFTDEVNGTARFYGDWDQ